MAWQISNQTFNNNSFIKFWYNTNFAVFTTSFLEKITEIYFITTSYSSQIYFIITSYMKYGWIWWRILDTADRYQDLEISNSYPPQPYTPAGTS